MANSGPKNFKSMTFPPARDGTCAVYAPLPKPPSPKAITLTESQQRAKQLEEMKVFANKQRCPVCDAQLDGPIGYDCAILYCRLNGEQQYKVYFKYGLEHIHWSITTYYTEHYAYEIETSYIEGNLFSNTLFKIDLSFNKKFQQSTKKNIFSYEGAILTFQKNISEEDLMSKIKLYTLFS